MNYFRAFYSQQAYQIARWALEENSRIKASRLMRIADTMEARYRQRNNSERGWAQPTMLFIPDDVPPRRNKH